MPETVYGDKRYDEGEASFLKPTDAHRTQQTVLKGTGTPTCRLRLAFIDADEWILDVYSLVVAISRSVLKTSELKLVDVKNALQDNTSLEKGLHVLCKKFLRRCRKEPGATEDESVYRIQRLLRTYFRLCRLRLGAVEFLTYLTQRLGCGIILVTSYPEIVLACLKDLLAELEVPRLWKEHTESLREPETQLPLREPYSAVVHRIFAQSPDTQSKTAVALACYVRGVILETPEVSRNVDRSSLECLFVLRNRLEVERFLPFAKQLLPSLHISNVFIARSPGSGSCASVGASTVSPETVDDQGDVDYFNEGGPLRSVVWKALLHISHEAHNLNLRFPPFASSFTYPSKVEPQSQHGPPVCPERRWWSAFTLLRPIIIFDSEVVSGFGRGSALLGLPTANLASILPEEGHLLPFPGIYFGFATLVGTQQCPNPNGLQPNDPLPCYNTVFSSGYNPYYENTRLTIEPYLAHTFPRHFRGARIRLVVVGVLRPEANFSEFGCLIQAIQNDCEVAFTILQAIRATQTNEDLNTMHLKGCGQTAHDAPAAFESSELSVRFTIYRERLLAFDIGGQRWNDQNEEGALTDQPKDIPSQ